MRQQNGLPDRLAIRSRWKYHRYNFEHPSHANNSHPVGDYYSILTQFQFRKRNRVLQDSLISFLLDISRLYVHCSPSSSGKIDLSLKCPLLKVMEPGKKGWLFYATENRVSQLLGSYLIATFANCYLVLMLILEHSFIYRCLVVCA